MAGEPPTADLPSRERFSAPARTLRLLAAFAVTLAAGLLSRLYPIGWFLYDHSLGDVLYAVAAYLVLALLCRRGPAVVAPLALVACWVIEAFQATGIPAHYALLFLVRWLLGTTFSWHDMFCYLVGIAVIAILDRVWLSR
jgi:hypothetical protein